MSVAIAWGGESRVAERCVRWVLHAFLALLLPCAGVMGFVLGMG